MSEDTQLPLNLEGTISDQTETNTPVICLGRTFTNDDERRAYFREELRKQLPELKKIEGYPIGEDDDIINLSDPPYYTACPNPWLNDFIAEWEKEKEELELQGKRSDDFKVTEPYASDVSEGKNNPIYMAHAYHTKVPHPAIMRYILHYTQPGDIVFDGFAGTGMTGVAANLCGSEKDVNALNEKDAKIGVRHGICSDLSPYASLIAYNYNTPSPYVKLLLEAVRIYKEVVSECLWMYETKVNSQNAIIDFIVWSESYICHNCGNDVVFWDAAVSFKDKCINDLFPCSNCGTLLDKKCERAYESRFDSRLDTVLSTAKTIPVLIVCTTKDGKRFEKRADDDDLILIEKIKNIQIDTFYPINFLPDGYNTQQPMRSQGIYNVHEFYTRRNLITLSIFYDKIIKSKYPEKLRFMFTGMMSRATKMNRFSPRNYFYGGGGWNLTGLSGTLYIPSLPIETSVLSILKTRVNVYKLINDLLPKEYDNLISVSSACSTLIKNSTIDYLFVDPPFGGNIMYSELNFLPEAWLKVITNNKSEAIINTVQKKTLFDYQVLMNRSFKEFYRILKPGKWLTMEFSNTSAAVWNSIQNALQGVGFIVVNVAALDKQQGSFKAVTTTTAVKQDLVITCYKPTEELTDKFKATTNKADNTWDFTEELLLHLPVHLLKENSTTAVVERNPKILYDRLISYYVQHGYPVPMNASEFQKGLQERFVERDGMFFTAEQALQYEEKRSQTTGVVQMSVFVSSEAEGIEWLKRKLNTPQTYSELNPQWMQDLSAPRKGDNIPELKVILEDNFLHDEDGRWYKPDLEKETDLEKVRTRKLLKEFNYYVELAAKPKVKIKEARLEALRCGFRECYRNNDFQTIVSVGNRLPEALIMEDVILLQFYDIALAKV